MPGPEFRKTSKSSRRTVLKSLLATAAFPLVDAANNMINGSHSRAATARASELGRIPSVAHGLLQTEPIHREDPPVDPEDLDKEEGGRLTADSLASTQQIRERAPQATDLEIRPLPGAERLKLSQINRTASYLQKTLDAMYTSNKPILIEYANTLAQRMQKGVERFVDVDGVDPEQVQTFLYFSPSSRETIYRLPYGPYIDDIGLDGGRVIIADAIEVLETPMVSILPNSEDSIFSLVYSLSYTRAQASRLTTDLRSKTPNEVMAGIRTPQANVTEVVYAVDQQMLAYDQSHQDLANIGAQPSAQLADFYSQWRVINGIANPNEREIALRELVIQRYLQ